MRNNEKKSLHSFIEVELKHFVSSPQDLQRILDSLKNFKSAFKNGHSSQAVSQYYDTKKLDFYNTGKTLRVRWGSDDRYGTQLSIKTHGCVTDDGAILRDEYEFLISGRTPDLMAVTHPDARKLIEGITENDLIKTFQTDVQRHTVDLDFEIDGKKVAFEIALDELKFTSPRSSTPLATFYEVEVEFKQNDSDPTLEMKTVLDAMNRIVREMKKAVPDMVLNTQSKAQIGYKLYKKHQETKIFSLKKQAGAFRKHRPHLKQNDKVLKFKFAAN